MGSPSPTNALIPMAPSDVRSVPAPLLDRIVQTMRPEQVWLFGSRAQGHARPDSDWDLLVVVPDDTSDDEMEIHSVWQKIMDLRIPADVIPVRHSEFAAFAPVAGSLSHEVKRTGVMVHHA